MNIPINENPDRNLALEILEIIKTRHPDLIIEKGVTATDGQN